MIDIQSRISPINGYKSIYVSILMYHYKLLYFVMFFHSHALRTIKTKTYQDIAEPAQLYYDHHSPLTT